MVLSDADYAKLLRLNCDHWALRLEFCFIKAELALRAGFTPNQQKAPCGNPDGGQWTDGGGGGNGVGSGQAELISSRPRSGNTVRTGERWVEATRLSVDARPVASPARVRGEWYIRPDGTVFSVRVSTRHGLTIDIIRTNDPLIPSRLKVHCMQSFRPDGMDSN